MGTIEPNWNATPYFVTDTDIDTYLSACKKIYNDCMNKTEYELYELFWQTLDNYETTNNPNFATIVHRLHPQAYRHKVSKYNQTSSSIFVCPDCSTSISIIQRFAIHMKHQTVPCTNCNKTITYDRLMVHMIMKRYMTEINHLFPNGKSNIVFPYLNQGLTFDNVKGLAEHLIRQVSCSNNRQRRNTIYMLEKLNRKWPLCKYNMDIICGMYIQLRFIRKIGQNFAHWDEQQNRQIMMERYWKFMRLFKSYTKLIVPTVDIDIVWHAHLINSTKYANFCSEYLYRDLIRHEDKLSSAVLDKAYTRTYMYWMEKYGEPYSPKPPDYRLFMSGSKDIVTNWFRQRKWNAYLNNSYVQQMAKVRKTPKENEETNIMADVLLLVYLLQIDQFNHNHHNNTEQAHNDSNQHHGHECIDDSYSCGGDGCGGDGCGGD